jgi:U4/U6 small nuclear ribonucleoprotein PRP4
VTLYTACATGSLDNSVRVWDLRRRGALYCITGHMKLVSHVQFDPLGGHYLLTASYDKTAKVWNSRTWQLCTTLAGHSGVVMAADIARDGSGSVVTTSYDKGIKLWRPEQEKDDDEAMEEG